jgi:hypothetical protein
MCTKAKKETKRLAEEKYGSYVSYRTDEDHQDSEDDREGEWDRDEEEEDWSSGVGGGEAAVV